MKLWMIAMFLFLMSMTMAKYSSFSFGVGMPEGINLGYRTCAIDRLQFGTCMGIFPYNNGTLFTIALDGFYLFGEGSRQSLEPLWDIRTGIIYTKDFAPNAEYDDIWLPAALGRKFHIAGGINIAAELGAIVNLYHHETEHERGWFELEFFSHVMPTIRMQMLIGL